MRKREKLCMLSALVALGGALLFVGLGDAADDTFEGTWYGNVDGVPLRIESHLEVDRLEGSWTRLDP